MKCALPVCDAEATKKVIWADGRAYQPSCDSHVRDVQKMLKKKNGEMTELAGVQDLTEGYVLDTIDLVSSAVYPGLERKPGGPDNWVEAAGGLPSYIKRIAKHLHYERGMSISRAIASAVNTVKRWARMGKVAKYGDPNKKHVTAKTAALAAKAVAEWMVKRKAGSLALSDDILFAIDLTDVTDDFAYELAVEMGDVIDLADADIEDTDTMVALMLPEAVASRIAVDGGVPAEDLHVTLTFNGEMDDAAHQQLIEDVTEYAKSYQGEPLKGTIGGIGTFPAQDAEQGQPWWVPVDLPGLATFREQLAGVADGASEEHGYTPHITLTYTKDGEGPPTPVQQTPVEFGSVWVVRGNSDRTEIPIGGGASADLTEHAILHAGEIDLPKGFMDIKALAERANRIEDPDARAAARQKVLDLAVPKSELTVEKRKQRAKGGQAMPDGSFPIFDETSLKSAIGLARTPEQRNHVIRRARALGLSHKIPEDWVRDLTETLIAAAVIDLASTIPPRNARGRVPSDGRKSFKGQGKWKHGFVPVSQAAAESKSKGSPIAMKRMKRLFGKTKKDDAPNAPNQVPKRSRLDDKPINQTRHPKADRVKAATGRAGGRSAGGRKKDPHEVKVDEKTRPGSERAKDIGFLRHSSVDAATNKPTAKLSDSQKEASKETRIPERARQNWDEIPETLKTVRGGKRYVLAEFGGKQYVTEWVGGVKTTESTALANRKVMRTLASADAAKMSQSELRALANNPKSPESVKRTARKALKSIAKAQEKVATSA